MRPEAGRPRRAIRRRARPGAQPSSAASSAYASASRPSRPASSSSASALERGAGASTPPPYRRSTCPWLRNGKRRTSIGYQARSGTRRPPAVPSPDSIASSGCARYTGRSAHSRGSGSCTLGGRERRPDRQPLAELAVSGPRAELADERLHDLVAVGDHGEDVPEALAARPPELVRVARDDPVRAVVGHGAPGQVRPPRGTSLRLQREPISTRPSRA